MFIASSNSAKSFKDDGNIENSKESPLCITRKQIMISIYLSEPVSKIVDHVKEQGTGQRESAAYTLICEHLEEVGNTAILR